MGIGLKAARQTVSDAASKVTASAETIAKGIGAAIGIALVALLAACIGVVLAVRGRKAVTA